jgi:hypothetical protein
LSRAFGALWAWLDPLCDDVTAGVAWASETAGHEGISNASSPALQTILTGIFHIEGAFHTTIRKF